MPNKVQFTPSSSTNGFIQSPIELNNVYLNDNYIQSVAQYYLNDESYLKIREELIKLGERVTNEIIPLGDLTERFQPQVIQFDQYGKRVDELIVHPAWNKLKEIGCEEGLISIPYLQKLSPNSRIYQFIKIYLYSPQNMYDCPLSMTDGLGKVIALYGTKEQKERILPLLTTNNPTQFITSGQWMTERTGGSDISNTETLAKKIKDNQYSIDGFKFFSSATDADYTLLLARIVDDNGYGIEGSKGLSLFLAKVKDENGQLNGVKIHRLKEKIGTKSLPTAELELKGMKAELIGEIGKGVKTISSVLQITRLHCAITSIAGLRRAFMMAKDYACKRKAFGKRLCDQPLHIAQLATIERTLRQLTQLVFYTLHLMDLEENLKASKEQQLLFRLLTPIVKLQCSQQSLFSTFESLESLGGLGYMEETGIGKILRDIMVNCIWEGTKSTMLLDVRRVFEKSQGLAWKVYVENLKSLLETSYQKIDSSTLITYPVFKISYYYLKQSISNLEIIFNPLFQPLNLTDLTPHLINLIPLMGTLLSQILIFQHASHLAVTTFNGSKDTLTPKLELEQECKVIQQFDKGQLLFLNVLKALPRSWINQCNFEILETQFDHFNLAKINQTKLEDDYELVHPLQHQDDQPILVVLNSKL